jgi:hypothetical protein
MIQLTTKPTEGTSFFNTIFVATPNQLIELIGKPQYMDNTGEDKTNMDWECELVETGDVFTIYDWKEYRVIGMDEFISWHIGGMNGRITDKAKQEILQGLKIK